MFYLFIIAVFLLVWGLGFKVVSAIINEAGSGLFGYARGARLLADDMKKSSELITYWESTAHPVISKNAIDRSVKQVRSFADMVVGEPATKGDAQCQANEDAAL